MKAKIFLSLCLLSLAGIGHAQIGQYNGKPRFSFLAIRAGDTVGSFVAEMYPSIAPLHVRNFDSLVASKFFDSTAFHRVIPGFVIQGGDPNSRSGPRSTWGFGDPTQQNIPAEFNPISHQRSIFSAARDTDPNSANSQFFVCVAAATHLDNNYTAYGKVISGMSIVDNIVASPRDANDNPFQKIEMFVRRIDDDSTMMLSAPQITAPQNNSIGVSGNYPFSWTEQADAIMYQLEFSRNSNMQPIDTLVRTTSRSIKIKSLQPGGVRYYWRLTSTNGGKKSSSAIQSFTTGEFPPSLQLPANNSTLQNNFVGFEWDTVAGVSAYRFQLATNPNFTTQSIVRTDSGLMNSRFFAENLQSNKKHFWRVASEIAGVPGDYSPSFSFTTGIASVGLEHNGELSFQIFPNPASTKLFVLNHENIDAVEICNLEGKTIPVMTKKLGKEAELDLSTLSDGVYILRVMGQHHRSEQLFKKQ